MPKAERGTPKDIANRQKAKGLQKLRWYCQMCQKECFISYRQRKIWIKKILDFEFNITFTYKTFESNVGTRMVSNVTLCPNHISGNCSFVRRIQINSKTNFRNSFWAIFWIYYEDDGEPNVFGIMQFIMNILWIGITCIWTPPSG